MKKYVIVCLSILVVSGVCARAADAKEIFQKSCAKCHGPDGKGQTKMGQKLGIKDFTDPKVQADLSEEKAFKAIKEGVKEDGKIRMKPAEDVTDEQIKALVAYVKAFKK